MLNTPAASRIELSSELYNRRVVFSLGCRVLASKCSENHILNLRAKMTNQFHELPSMGDYHALLSSSCHHWCTLGCIVETDAQLSL